MDIQDDYVWPKLSSCCDQTAAVGDNPNDLKLRLKQALARVGQELMIIGN
jgi:hypothetical protein